MALKYYGYGEHPAGFVGFRVAVSFGEQKFQEYFSTSKAEVQDSSNYYFAFQDLSAQLQAARWRLESLAYQYNKFVTTSHPLTKPFRGVGVHCITMDFSSHGETSFVPVFEVTITGQGPKRISLQSMLFSEAWEEAVNLWSETHMIKQEDHERVLANPPSPQQFKELRRQLNAEGKDVGVESLSWAFKEQRLAIAEARDRQAGVGISKSIAAPISIDTQLAGEMMGWLEEKKQAFSLKK